MYWKVFNIQTGQIIKAGFKTEDSAKEWLETHRPGREENYLAEEMDEDELEEWRAENEDSDDKIEEPEEEEDDEIERGRYSYSTDDDDEDEKDEDLLSEVEDDD